MRGDYERNACKKRTKPVCQNERWLWKECMLTELNQYVKMSVDYERNACKKN